MPDQIVELFLNETESRPLGYHQDYVVMGGQSATAQVAVQIEKLPITAFAVVLGQKDQGTGDS